MGRQSCRGRGFPTTAPHGRTSTQNKSALSRSIKAIAARAAVPGLILFFSATSAGAQSSSANYTLVVASGFLCDPGESGSCPAIAKSANGDSYEIGGAGTFDIQHKAVNAAGTFNHKSTNGSLLETGVWTASALISFESYGIAPAGFMQRGPAFGGPQIGHKRLPMLARPLPTGGLAKFRIILMPVSGATRTAVLQVNCALGAVPRERSVDGIRLTIETSGTEFSGEGGGRVMFLSIRPEVNAPIRPPQQEPAVDSAAPPSGH